MNNFYQKTYPINNIIQKTWKWPQYRITIKFEGEILLESVFFRINKSWGSLPHQSVGGLSWNEGLVNKLLNKQIFIGNLKEFHKTIFFILYKSLAHIENCDKRVKVQVPRHSEQNRIFQKHEFIIQLNSLNLQSFKFSNPKYRTKLFIRSKYILSPYYKSHKVISELKLKHSFNDQLQYFSSSVRRKIQKAKRNGIKVEIGSLNDLDLFYTIYRKRIHQLGSMGLPKKYFHHQLQKENEGWLNLIFAMYKEKCIGVAILNINAASAENLYFATSKKHNHLYPSYALHAKMIDLSIKANCTHYSFGRSTINSGVHRYKQQWGAKDKILYYNYSWDKKDHLWIQKMASIFISLLPISFVRLFDFWVSKKWY